MGEGNENLLNYQNKDFPPYNHEFKDVAKACGIDTVREGGMLDSKRKVLRIMEKLDKVCTSQVVEVIESQSSLSIRETILLALLMGLSKGYVDAHENFMKLIKKDMLEKGLRGMDDKDEGEGLEF